MTFLSAVGRLRLLGVGALILTCVSCGDSSPPADTVGGAGNAGTVSGGKNTGGSGGSSSGSAGSGRAVAGTAGANATGGAAGVAAAGGAGDDAQGGRGGDAGSQSGGMTDSGSPGSGGSVGAKDSGNSGGSGLGSDASGGFGGSRMEGGAGGTVNCPAGKLVAGDTNKTVSVAGASRTYILHIPSAYKGDAPVPFIIDFHGLAGSGSGETFSSYSTTAGAEGVVMAFPDGKPGPLGNAWNVGPCCVDTADDVAFAKALVADVEKVACIDPKRVYAVGFSMGGGLSHYLACHAADVFAAVSPAAFDLLQENVGDCKPTRPITVFSFRSTADPIVPYAGGASSLVPGHPITFLGAVNTFKKWAQINKCTEIATDAGGGCQTYSQCDGGVEVTLCTKQGGGHEAGDATKSWPVLKKYTLP